MNVYIDMQTVGVWLMLPATLGIAIVGIYVRSVRAAIDGLWDEIKEVRRDGVEGRRRLHEKLSHIERHICK